MANTPPGPSIPAWLLAFPVELVVRIDLGLEGAWSETVETVWEPERGFAGFGDIPERHARYRHAIEYYLSDGWIGVHCFRRDADEFILDRTRATALIEHAAASHRDRS